MKPIVTFHIGYPKSGSTWLQKHVFPRIPKIHYVGRKYEPGELLPKLEDELWMYQLGFFPEEKYDGEATRETLRREISSDLPNMISFEGFVRPGFVERTAQRLRSLTEGLDARIVISIRRQRDIMLSRYTHDLKTMPKRYRFEQALDFTGEQVCVYPLCRERLGESECYCLNRNAKTISVEYYNYLHTYRVYTALFGLDAVHIVVLERMAAEERGDALEKLLKAAGASVAPEDVQPFLELKPENKRSAADYEAMLKFNGKSLEVTLEQLERYYTPLNRQLGEQIGVDLDRYGYCPALPPAPREEKGSALRKLLRLR